jgi:hypothetical protein
MFGKVRDQKPGTLGSQDWFDPPDNIDETAFHIERVLAQGLTIEERTPDGS